MTSTENQIKLSNDTYLVDENPDGITDYSYGKPDLNFVQFRSKLIDRDTGRDQNYCSYGRNETMLMLMMTLILRLLKTFLAMPFQELMHVIYFW